MGRLFIVGCSGHGKVVADIALKLSKYDEIVFLDDNPAADSCLEFPVIGNSAYEDITNEDEIIVAIGNPVIRRRLQEQYAKRSLTVATLIHPDAVLGVEVKIGEGSVIMAGAIINPDSVIGKGVIINTGATADHDNIVCDYAHISVGAHLAGNVTIGKSTWIGAGAVVSNNLCICDNAMIGAGTVVIRDIEEPGTYVGVPARKIR